MYFDIATTTLSVCFSPKASAINVAELSDMPENATRHLGQNRVTLGLHRMRYQRRNSFRHWNVFFRQLLQQGFLCFTKSCFLIMLLV